jgi:hypothetical protein
MRFKLIRNNGGVELAAPVIMDAVNIRVRQQYPVRKPEPQSYL